MKHSKIKSPLFILLLVMLFCIISNGQTPQKLYPVYNGSKYGLIDSKRKQVVDYIYDYVSRFRNGVSIVKRKGKFGILNFHGIEVVQPIFGKIELTDEGLSIATVGDSSNIFDKNGLPLCSEWYYKIEPAGHGYFMITKKTEQGSRYIKNTIKHFHLEDILGLARDSVYFSEFLISYLSGNNRLLKGIWFSGGEMMEDGRFKVAISKHTYYLDTLGNISVRTPDPCDLSLMNIFQPDEVPEYPGGIEELNAFLNNNLKYPEDPEKYYHNATVIVSFIIDQSGNVINTKVVKSVSPEFDTMVIKALLRMKQWNPAKYNGKPVCWQTKISVDFSIKGM